ncbi:MULTISPECIES: SDR family NAD(P)-dependent oxidoreductase [unclassified Methylobacterium]|uniref:SDR family NAD(P)-dependent oxidoreductase n=1 Tax=unclassified Methylobacterium TaxID=2615210 RepID=UPI0006F487FB|nr:MULTISPECIES: SDR family NAD(P)-dependent oxidoreductase [unclassified Methylobacterium]KQO60739.1 oxidoreductase [Methylobacterium sp. Leaf86]KQO86538.1 oxidoreductase [Methylobacterium sp. Leaf91]
MTKPLDGRIALVTGCSRGIGRAAALALAEAGAHIVAVARTQGALEELDDAIRQAGSSATLVPLDLTDFDAIDRLGLSIYERWQKLDVVVGNAGILGNLTPLGHVTPKTWTQVMDINVTANWRLLRSVDPLLRRSDAGRAIFVTSGAAQKCKAYWGPYSVSKAALDALVRTYAAETETTPIKAMLLNPGPLRTSMRKAAMPGEDETTLKTPDDLAPHFVRLASRDWDQSGKIYDFPSDRVLTPQMAA